MNHTATARIAKTAAYTTMLLTASACGGGGSGASSAPPSPSATHPKESSAQASAIASRISADLEEFRSSAALTLFRYHTYYSDFKSGSFSGDCATTGSASHTVNWNGGGVNDLTGNFTTTSYANCVYNRNPTIYDGTVTTKWISGSGDPTTGSTWNAKLTITYQQYSVSELSGRTVLDGSVTYDISSRYDIVAGGPPDQSAIVTYSGFKKYLYTNSSTSTAGPYVLARTENYGTLEGGYAFTGGAPLSLTLKGKRGVAYENGTGSYEFDYVTASPFIYDSGGKPTGGSASVTVRSSGSLTGNMFTIAGNVADVDTKWSVVDSTTGKLESDLDDNGSFETSYSLQLSGLSP